MPAIISPLIMGYIWYLLLQPGRGILFTVFDRMGHPEWFGNWMGSYTTTMIVLVLVNVWQYAGHDHDHLSCGTSKHFPGPV